MAVIRKPKKAEEGIGSFCAVTLVLHAHDLRQFAMQFQLNFIILCFDIPLRGSLILNSFQKKETVMPMLRIIFVLLALTPIAAIAHSPIAYVLPKDGAVINKSPEAIEIVFTGPSKLIKVSLQKFAPEANKSLVGSLLGSGEGVDIASVSYTHLRAHETG